MSERILKALMQLFAIIARPESNKEDRRRVVESFLDQMLNKELVEAYLTVFDEFYYIYQEQQKRKSRKKIALSSVRVLKICDAINKELIQKQKTVVLIRLLEFIKSDTEEITEQEIEFVDTVASSFYIPDEEYKHIQNFVLNAIEEIPLTKDLLIINENPTQDTSECKHIYSPGLTGELRVLNIDSTNTQIVRYFGEKELYLNGQLIQADKVYILTTGSSLRNPAIRPIYYGDIVSTFRLDNVKSRVVFEAKDIEYFFPGGKQGLHAISFIEESGRMIGIMGASGAGKSTLLMVLNGTNPPSSGEILINGYNIHEEKDKIEGIIGYVSQDDLLIEELTVFQNLYYNAKLCFDNFTKEQLVETVELVLENLGLKEIKGMKVGSPLNKKISGGQRKRLNIALELIREPAVLFLDEPTSGLSSRDSENIMDLLKELSLKGKLVFVVIHQPSSDIFKMFDKLLILDKGGYLIYDGDPVDSIIYFKSRIQQADWNDSECPVCGNVNPEQVFNIVEAQVLDEYGNLTQSRKIAPLEWNKHYNRHLSGVEHEIEPAEELPEITFKIPNKFRQFKVFSVRDILSKLTNTQYLTINLLEAPILAVLLSYIIKYFDVTSGAKEYLFSENSNVPVYLFMAVIIAIFIGLTVSAEEIIRDRKILKRERFLNLSRTSYLFSKVAIMVAISAIQAFLFVIVGNTIMEIKGMYFSYWLILFSTWVFANLLGLNISDSFKTSVTIYILIPFLVIPQIILSGIIVKFDKINPNISSPVAIPWYGEIMTARWAYEALAVHQFKNNDFQKEFYLYDKWISIARYKKDFWLTTVQNKLNWVERELEKMEDPKKLKAEINLIRKEIKKELADNPKFKLSVIDNITIEKLSKKDIGVIRKYFEEIRSYYVKLANRANDKKDEKVVKMHQGEHGKEAFLRLKQKNDNESLNDFVKNSEVIRIVEYDGELHQKTDPIFFDPPHPFVKAHFYAPRKQFLGQYYDTYWVNFGVIWFMTIFLYISLHFSALKGLLESLGRAIDKIIPQKER